MVVHILQHSEILLFTHASLLGGWGQSKRKCLAEIKWMDLWGRSPNAPTLTWCFSFSLMWTASLNSLTNTCHSHLHLQMCLCVLYVWSRVLVRNSSIAASAKGPDDWVVNCHLTLPLISTFILLRSIIISILPLLPILQCQVAQELSGSFAGKLTGLGIPILEWKIFLLCFLFKYHMTFLFSAYIYKTTLILIATYIVFYQITSSSVLHVHALRSSVAFAGGVQLFFTAS